MRVPAHETADSDVPLEAFWGRRDAARLRERLLERETPDAALDAFEAALLEKWTQTHPHPAVRFAVGTFDRAPHLTSVTEVTNAIGLSPKRFIERFKAEIGITPKRYCRIRRFQRALTQIYRGESVDWARVATDGGYFDQAHFIHDFRSFAGLTPTQYQAGRTRFPNHVKFLQDAGRGVQARSSHDG
jgi:AraC-like DNA-binding protein